MSETEMQYYSIILLSQIHDMLPSTVRLVSYGTPDPLLESSVLNTRSVYLPFILFALINSGLTCLRKGCVFEPLFYKKSLFDRRPFQWAVDSRPAPSSFYWAINPACHFITTVNVSTVIAVVSHSLPSHSSFQLFPELALQTARQCLVSWHLVTSQGNQQLN